MVARLCLLPCLRFLPLGFGGFLGESSFHLFLRVGEEARILRDKGIAHQLIPGP